MESWVLYLVGFVLAIPTAGFLYGSYLQYVKGEDILNESE